MEWGFRRDMTRPATKLIEAPPGDEHVVNLGEHYAWGGPQPLLLSRGDRRHHAYVIGKTGVGKSTLLRSMILQDIHAGEGVCLIDPHGDLAADILDHFPRWRADDLVYFDPADHEFPLGLNLLRRVEPERRHLVAAGMVNCFKSIWSDSWGPRLEYLLNATVAALLECQNVTLLGVPRMLVDADYRRWVLKQCTDPVVRSFWLHEFAGYDKRMLAEVISPLQNKVGALLLARPLRNVLGQVRTKFDARFMMDNKRVLIANLSKGRLGAEPSSLLGAVLVTQFQLAAMSRADVPPEQRRDFHMYIDEFQNFGTDSFVSILSESRKYGLALVLAHQYLDQLRPEVREAVWGNVGSLISFRVGESDAAVLAREFGAGLEPGLFSGLSNHEICCKLLVAGKHAEPVLGKTSPVEFPRYGRRYPLIERSRQRFAAQRTVVEDRIRRWMGREALIS